MSAAEVMTRALLDSPLTTDWWLPRWLDRILPHVDLEGGHTDGDVITVDADPELVAA